jgi:endogenous inhibitor of DNA gyrase (YacG/DUF329 family)
MTTAATCPVCGKPTDERFKPFCSGRCKQVDLHRWLGEVYTVPGEEGPANEDGDGEGRGDQDDE